MRRNFTHCLQTIVAERVPIKNVIAQKIVRGAKAQYGTLYDASFQNISYPNGDVARNRGACTDVVIRALRAAGFDLQQLMHADMTRSFHLYPKKWNLNAPNANIDHRRVPNQMTYFSRHARVLPIEFNSVFVRHGSPVTSCSGTAATDARIPA